MSPEQGTVRLGQFYHRTKQVFSPDGVEKEGEKHSPAGRVGHWLAQGLMVSAGSHSSQLLAFLSADYTFFC